MIFEFRGIERPLPRENLKLEASGNQRLFEGALHLIPELVSADPLLRPGGHGDPNILKAEIAINAGGQFAKAYGLLHDLLFGTKNMGVVLGKLPDAHDPMQGAMGFVTVTAAELRHPDGQITVGSDPLTEDLNMGWAVHRFDGH